MPYLFFVGNKRSGTSLLVELLNFHPDVFITPESDIVWILYQMQAGRPETFRCYPWDGAVGMNRTLEVAGSVLKTAQRNGNGHEQDLPELFDRVQAILRANAGSDQAGKVPRWSGDKKPVQQADPEIRPFLRRHFPDAKYIHIVRDPACV